MGPHIGVLYGKYELLGRLRAYKGLPAPGDPRAGCPSGQVKDGDAESLERSLFAGMVGTLAAVNYLAEIGQQYGSVYQDRFPGFSDRRIW